MRALKRGGTKEIAELEVTPSMNRKVVYVP
jgi:hypothetical protein